MKTRDRISTDRIRGFLAALEAGRCCLHPTDTIPGLTFHPESPEGRETLIAFKGREPERPFLGLVDSFETAKAYWQPLPPLWSSLLSELWPAPLSVIWKASSRAPASMVHRDGTLGLRVPRLKSDDDWFQQILVEWKAPLPTTSINRTGERPARHWREGVSAVQGVSGIYVPPTDWDQVMVGEEEPVPSTLVMVHEDGGYEILRKGAFNFRMLQRRIAERTSTGEKTS